jgi:hypothetical protein
MRRLMLTMGLAGALAIALAVPAAGAPGSKPTSAIAKPGGCDTIRYDWSQFGKARTATIRLHHDGIFVALRSTPAGSSGSYPIPADLLSLIESGEHYTVLGHLQDSAGRSITPSGAVWWGVC